MDKVRHIVYALLWVSYAVAAYYCFPKLNSNPAIATFVLLAIGSWLYGTTTGLLILLAEVPYHYFLFDYYGMQFDLYQTKVAGILVSALVVMIVGALKQTRDELRQASILLDQEVRKRTSELNQLIEQLIDEDENARRKLGQDIHDGLGQTLTGLLLFSSSIQENLKNHGSCGVENIDSIVADTQKNLHLARKVSRTLFPFKMMGTSFDAAIDELISYFKETTAIKFEVKLDGTETRFPDNVMIHFYRIVYECILNTLHYETPTSILIKTHSNGNTHRLRVKIDGCNEPMNICNNIFVELMRYRAKLIEGELTSIILPDNSIQFECTVPSSLAPIHTAHPPFESRYA